MSAKKSGPKAGRIDWEKSMNRLEEIVRDLEGGKASLDESLRLFEEGNALVKDLEKTLAEAELQVRKILDRGEENVEEEPFGGEDRS